MTTDLTARLDADAAHAQHIQRVRAPFTSGDDTAWLLARLGERDAALRAVLDLHRADGDYCAAHDMSRWPCPTVAAVVSAMSAAPDDTTTPHHHTEGA